MVGVGEGEVDFSGVGGDRDLVEDYLARVGKSQVVGQVYLEGVVGRHLLGIRPDLQDLHYLEGQNPTRPHKPALVRKVVYSEGVREAQKRNPPQVGGLLQTLKDQLIKYQVKAR